MKNESQYGLLLLQRYLYEHTDDQHPASVADILAFWQEHGIQAGRKSVYSAIEVLQSSGMDIVCVKSTQNRYFVGERLFELPELKLLVDAVESSHFITAKKSERLIEKLGKLTSESHARQLDRHIYMDGTAKPENECIYYSVDEIHNAIQKKRQITFQYYEYTPQKEKILKHNGYRYQFSPYALIWSRDCYYAVGWSEKHGKIAQFRVDRMTAVEPLEHTAVQTPDFDPAEYVRKVFGMYPDNLCNIAYAGFSAPKLLWVKKHEPEAFRQIAKIMLPKDYLVYKLTGAFSTDPSDASGTLFFDVDRRCWSEEMLEICGIQEHMLPKVYESYEPVGHLKEAICDRFGLGKVVFAAGAGDNAAAAIGTGTVDEGTCTISLGTSGTVFIPTKQNYPDKNYALHAFAHATGEYHLMGCILCAAACGKWWMEEILETNDYVEEQADIQRLGENPIYFLPYMMGERSPHNDPSARGVFLGLSLDTTRAQMTQSIYEGVAFALRDNLEIAAKNGVSVKKARLCGGGAKSPLWWQIIADVLNIEIEILEKEEGPSSGAAILAAVACGAYSDVSTVSRRNASITEIVRPDTDVSSKYDLRYGVFKQLYPKMKEIYQLL